MPLFELSFIFRDFGGTTAKNPLILSIFGEYKTSQKQPSKIAKQPLTYKTRNAKVVGHRGAAQIQIRIVFLNIVHNVLR